MKEGAALGIRQPLSTQGAGPPVFPSVGQEDKMITAICFIFLKAVILCVTHFMKTLASVAQ